MELIFMRGSVFVKVQLSFQVQNGKAAVNMGQNGMHRLQIIPCGMRLKLIYLANKMILRGTNSNLPLLKIIEAKKQ